MRTSQGLFGTVFHDYERKGQEAVNFLLKKKEGEVQNAIYNSEIGWIDIVWGAIGSNRKNGFGLCKIKALHPEVIENLAEIIKPLTVKSKSDNRYILQDKKYRAVVSRVWVETEKLWLLTAFEEIKKR